jgi:serine/threonine protein kinase
MSEVEIISKPNDVYAMYNTPNKYARPAYLEETENVLTFHGYQEFSLDKDSLSVLDIDDNLRKKKELLDLYFTPRFLSDRTLTDFGANSGYFCFLALNNGGNRAIAIDMDEDYLRMIQRAKSKYGYNNLDIIRSNTEDWNEPSDIVLALALIHWIYSCTASFGDLNSIIEKFAKLTKYMLIIEWVEPDDPAINFFHHLNWNEKVKRGPYTLKAFEDALSNNFARYHCIGSVTPTRKIFIAYRTNHEIDFSGLLPIIKNKETIISRCCLTNHEGKEYWSCVYDGGDAIFKQATKDLAEREASFLSQLNHEYFPKLLEVKSETDYSVLKMEKIHGHTLCKATEYLNSSHEIFNTFIQHCLNLLEILQGLGIEHRDIRPDNIIIRDKKPVLIDFGWAISKNNTFFTPITLNTAGGRPLDGLHSDIYSMGKILDFINRHKHPKFDLVIELMTEEDRLARITNLDCLKQLFAAISRDGNARLSMETNNEQLIINQLLLQSQRYRALLTKAQAQVAEREQLIQTLTTQVQTLSTQVAGITNSKSWKIALLFRKIRVLLAPPNSRRARALRQMANIASDLFKKFEKLEP